MNANLDIVIHKWTFLTVINMLKYISKLKTRIQLFQYVKLVIIMTYLHMYERLFCISISVVIITYSLP
jgi:hypothetical protein